MRLILIGIVLALCVGDLHVLVNAQATNSNSKTPAQQISGTMRPEFRELALTACKAIQRIPVLEQSAEIYDFRLTDAQKSVDKVEFAASDPLEKAAVAHLNAGLAKLVGYRNYYETQKLRRKIEDEKDVALGYSGPSAEVSALSRLEAEAKSTQALSVLISSDMSLDELFDALKSGKLPAAVEAVSEREKDPSDSSEKTRNFSGTYVSTRRSSSGGSDAQDTVVTIVQIENGIEIRKIKDGKEIVRKCPLNGTNGTFSEFGREEPYRVTARIEGGSLLTETAVSSVSGAPSVTATSRERWFLSADGGMLFVQTSTDSPQPGSPRPVEIFKRK